ncbi:MAG: glycosyltransferase [bacterium]|nr:glycosyltransferase [bacterium]
MHERCPLPESLVAKMPFQLLPGAVYQPEALERGLRWQVADAAFFRKPEVLVLVELSYENVRAKEQLDALRTQSFQHFTLGLVRLPDATLPNLPQSHFSGLTIRQSGTLETFSSIAGEYDFVVLVGSDVILHPSALYIISREWGDSLRGSSSEPRIGYSNTVFISANHQGEYFFRREQDSQINQLFWNTMGNLLIISPVVLQQLFEFSNSKLARVPGMFRFLADVPAMASLLKLPTYLIPLGLTIEYQHASREMGLPEAVKYMLASAGLSGSESSVGQHLGLRVYRHTLARLSAKIDVVIPFHNQSELTCRAIRSLRRQKNAPDLRLILVDNKSTLDEHERVKSCLEDCGVADQSVLLQDQEYFNFARINNRAASYGHAPYILFMNNDVELQDERSLQTMLSWMALSKIGAVGGTLVYPEGTIQSAGIRFLPVRPANMAIAEHFVGVTREVEALSLALCLVRRKAWSDVGGLDERHCPNGYGDALFGAAMRSHGWYNLQLAEVSALHHESVSRGFKPEDYEVYTLQKLGIEIGDLSEDFRSGLRPTLLSLSPPSQQPLDRIFAALKRRERLRRIVEILLAPIFKLPFFSR